MAKIYHSRTVKKCNDLPPVPWRDRLFLWRCIDPFFSVILSASVMPFNTPSSLTVFPLTSDRKTGFVARCFKSSFFVTPRSFASVVIANILNREIMKDCILWFNETGKMNTRSLNVAEQDSGERSPDVANKRYGLDWQCGICLNKSCLLIFLPKVSFLKGWIRKFER